MAKSLVKSSSLNNSFEAYAVCTLQDCKDLYSSKASNLYCISGPDSQNTNAFARGLGVSSSTVRTNLRITK